MQSGRCIALCLACHVVLGCNAVLGISAPLEVDDDSGVFNDARVVDDAGNDDDAATFDAGREPTDVNHARPRWPMPNPALDGNMPDHPQSYAIEGDLVIDRVTGLTWQRAASSTSMAWSVGYSLCANLTIDGGGFRLPSRIELVSLLDLTRADSAIDHDAFPNTPAEGFWSSSRSATTTQSAWGVSFGFSTGITFQDDLNHERRVRCVRSPDDEGAASRFVENDGVVDDSATQLQWQQAGLTTQYAWDAAQLYCDTLALQGNGWRLPTLKELHTLVDETRQNPAADGGAFPGVAAGYYWTSSQPRSFVDLAWTVGFDRGLDVFRGTTSTAFVRCVR